MKSKLKGIKRSDEFRQKIRESWALRKLNSKKSKTLFDGGKNLEA